MSTTLLAVQTAHAVWEQATQFSGPIAHQTQGSSVNHLASNNPFDGVAPDFSIFGAKFTAWWQKALAGVWGLALVYCGFKLIHAFVSMQSAKRHRNAVGMSERTEDLQVWAASTGGVVLAGAIMGALLAAFS